MIDEIGYRLFMAFMVGAVLLFFAVSFVMSFTESGGL